MKGNLVALLLLVTALAATARMGGIRLYHLGVAPLLGHCSTVDELVRLANQRKNLIRGAVIQAGNREMAEQVVNALCFGQVQLVYVPGNQALETMAWHGTSSSGITGIHTLWNPQLAFNSQVPCWRFTTTFKSKTVIWLLPQKCGNLSRLKVIVEQDVVIKRKPELPPPPDRLIGFAANTQRSTFDKITPEVPLGTTTSGVSFAILPKSPDINVTQNGGGAKSSSSSSSASSAANENNINNTNLNQNNNSAISQSQNVVPVNVVVNTGPGNANGTATGSGAQDAGANQTNNP